ncbi:unnamed protein product [Angiostrongylus costaricensis]|uniref:SH2 domain-containing protein n=1 Tax=Angiostrongylus costaricensis TaxID=334426 RepID=A0A0R3PME3_ANGCS|nr:unnamed protein product [Angiostrongylus costaricensis]
MLPTNEIATSLCLDDHDDSSMQQSTSSSSSPCLMLKVKLATPPDYTGRPWYHGEISQAEAEVLLEDAKPGRFLVRKAGPTRYFLSCVTDNNLLLHLPIFIFEQTLGLFRAFVSSTSRGDVITEIHPLEKCYILARNERTGQTGYMSAKTLDPIVSLTNLGAGAFLVRSSSQGADAFALLVNTRDKIEKFLIRGGTEGSDGFFLAGRRFPSLQHIIDRYCVHPIANNVRLTHAVLSSASRSRVPTEDQHGVAVAPGTTSTSEWSPNVTYIEATDDYFNHNCASNTVAAVFSFLTFYGLFFILAREEKAWKPCWLTLCDDPNDGSCFHQIFLYQLVFQSAKVRLVLDLAYCVMYLLDDSVFSREGCIFFSQTDIDLPGVYLCFRPTHVLIKWLELSESLKQDGFYSHFLNICGPPSVIFDCSFLLPLLPPENGTLQFSVLSHTSGGKKGRPLGVSALLSLPDSLPYSDSPELGFTFHATRYRFRSFVLIFSVMRQDSFTTTLLTQTLRILEDAFDAIGVANLKLLQPTEVDHIVAVLDKLVSPTSLVCDLLVVVAQLASERFPDEPHLVRRVLRFVSHFLILSSSKLHMC